MNHLARLAGLGVLALAGLWLLSSWVAGVRVVSIAPPDQVSAQAPATGITAVGMAGCSASNCHGGAIPTRAKSPESCWKWSATIWLQEDQHANAYRTLLSDQSAEIVHLLARGEGSYRPAYQDARCLACHSNPTLADQPTDPAVELLRLGGVTCEACHGNAGSWLRAHLAWTPDTNRIQEYKGHGMVWLNDLEARAGVCAGCHVGAPADPKARIPLREVNHDLIAAGHPRLNFEFATYQRLLPPHWQEKNRVTSQPALPGFEARAWVSGQKATVAAALDLLIDRLERVRKASPSSTWPELSEFNCYSCHHDLDPQGWRARSAEPTRWLGSWYRSADLDQPHRTANLGPDVSPFLAPDLWRRGIRPEELLQRAGDARKALASPLVQPGPVDLLQKLRPRPEDLQRLSWDQAGQLYHALVAIELDRRKGLGNAKAPDDLDGPFEKLADALRLPGRQPGVEEKRFDSPKNHDPDKIRELLENLFKELEQRLHPGR